MGNRTLLSSQKWVLQTNTWQTDNETASTYDTNGKVISFESRNYVNEIQISGYRKEYFYNASGQDEEQLSYNYLPGVGEWRPLSRDLQYFNPDGTVDYFKRFNWNEAAQSWDLYSRTLHEYQNIIHPEEPSVSTTQTWDDSTLTWNNLLKGISLYTDFGTVVLLDVGQQIWNPLTAAYEHFWAFKYYLSKIFTPADLTSPPVDVSCQLANPVISGASVTCASLPPGETIFARLTDLAGRTLFCQKISNDGAFTMPQYLPTGLYILTLTAEQSGVIFKEKLVVK